MKNALDSEAKAERERDHAWETCKRALHKVDNLIARAEKAEKDRDVAEAERDDAIHTAQDNAAEVEQLKADLAAALALLQEARETWIKVGYGASHEDVAECRDLCKRIDAELAEKGE